ncbi:uncharacterized protein LOC114830050 [Esox lucius]|nr:uncharacterized protein LOC114830050 [Esox lucius]
MDTPVLTEEENDEEEDEERKITLEDREEELEEDSEEDSGEQSVEESEDESEEKAQESEPQNKKVEVWVPTCYSKCGKEVFHYVGEDISIFEGYEAHGAVTWPGALALCRYLETNVEQFNLVDKSVLELGAGPGLVSIVATLLGAWVTATDLPEIVGNLRANLLRNTRGRCRHIPQAAVLSWGPDVEHTYPKSIYRYNYVLAADVVFQKYYLDELLFTMTYFCRPGTTLIWANKIRSTSDLEFTEDFKNTFNTTQLAEIDGVKIHMATCRQTEENTYFLTEEENIEENDEECNEENSKTKLFLEVSTDTLNTSDQEMDTPVLTEEENNDEEEDEECKITLEDREEELEENSEEDSGEQSMEESEDESEEKAQESEPQNKKVEVWVPTCYSKCGKEVFHYVGEDISIFEGYEAHGAVTWPGALALCRYLETNVEQFNLVDKSVLELGAGPGLVSIVATLLGAWVTATDLPEIVGNLRANLLRNTRGRCRHIPQAAVLSWGPDVEHTYPKSIYRYNYVLAADVVFQKYYLDKLLFTMTYFCHPGTTLIWANKIRSTSDLEFTEDFKNTFNTTQLAEIDGVKIHMATCRQTEERLQYHPAG